MTPLFPAFAPRLPPPDGELLGQSVGAEGDRLRALLARSLPTDLTWSDIRLDVAGHLWMVSPKAFQYFLPAFMWLAVEYYVALRDFAAELVSALTEPSRDDVVRALDRAAQIPPEMGLTPETLGQLRQQQLEWYDSGTPVATYRERVAGLSALECAAVLNFLATIRDDHGEDFPYGEPQIAIDRHPSCCKSGQ